MYIERACSPKVVYLYIFILLCAGLPCKKYRSGTHLPSWQASCSSSCLWIWGTDRYHAAPAWAKAGGEFRIWTVPRTPSSCPYGEPCCAARRELPGASKTRSADTLPIDDIVPVKLYVLQNNIPEESEGAIGRMNMYF